MYQWRNDEYEIEKDFGRGHGFFAGGSGFNRLRWGKEKCRQRSKGADGKTVAGFETPEAAQAYQLLADMVKDGSGLHATNEEGFQAYLSGKLGMVCTTIGKRANFEKAAKFNVKAAPFPAFNGKEVKFPAGGNFLMVFSKNAEKQKAAVEFIKYLESPAALAKWSTGTGYLPPRKGWPTIRRASRSWRMKTPILKWLWSK